MGAGVGMAPVCRNTLPSPGISSQLKYFHNSGMQHTGPTKGRRRYMGISPAKHASNELGTRTTMRLVPVSSLGPGATGGGPAPPPIKYTRFAVAYHPASM